MLACAAYLLEEEFNAVSPFVLTCIEDNLKRRILLPYLTAHFWWMEHDDEPMCNWIGGSKLENYAKSIERSNKMLNLLNSAVDILRSKHKHGEQYYWILYYSYLSPQQLQNTDEIIESLMPHIANISKRTYYRKRPEAVQALSSILWGYTSKDCLEMLNKFFPDI